MATDKNSDEVRAKFLAALEKKKSKNAPAASNGLSAGSKIKGSQAGGAPAARFQRKSGPSGSAG